MWLFLRFFLALSLLIACNTNPVEFGHLNRENTDVFTDSSIVSEVTDVHALIVYAQDSDDDYPLPDKNSRIKLYERISEYFRVMSYRKHQLHFQEVLKEGDYFRTENAQGFYKDTFQRKSTEEICDGPFALFNKEILNKVKEEKGSELFDGIDLLIMVTTDGGPGWYMPSVNAQGYARLGFNFEVNERTFGAQYGGITVEIGSDFLHDLYKEVELYWIFAHEYSHWLGFRRHRSDNTGVYSLMTKQLFASQNTVENGLGPNPLDPFLLRQFGWLDFEDSTRVKKLFPDEKEAVVRLNPIRSTEGLVLVQISLPGTTPTGSTAYSECFYVAYHKKGLNQFDDIYAGEGLLIWHSVLDNYFDVECRQGLSGQPNRDHFDVRENMSGLETDFFIPQNDDVFTTTSNPNTNIWGLANSEMANLPTGISITALREVDGMMEFRVVFGDNFGD